jgi:hypothetical protein
MPTPDLHFYVGHCGNFYGADPERRRNNKRQKNTETGSFPEPQLEQLSSLKIFVQFGISAIQALTFVIIGNQITGIRGMLFDYGSCFLHAGQVQISWVW